MPKVVGIVWVIVAAAMAAIGTSPKAEAASKDDHNSIVIVFKDGRQQRFQMADIARIEFASPATSVTGAWPAHFLGKWRVGDGSGGTFLITLERNGDAKKSIGSTHGTWMAVDGEARISWDDGWHDAIRKTGDGYEKAAFEPGRTFSDDPSNVGDAKKHSDPI
jgi:hypothetical protein